MLIDGGAAQIDPLIGDAMIGIEQLRPKLGRGGRQGARNTRFDAQFSITIEAI